jgi:hypothetical protein
MSWQFLGTNTLVWQPDTRIQTFPSGLVLVQRSAICRNTYLTTARGSITVGAALPCESPSTVTVFQFPQPQEIHGSNGFVRFDVSGYGKWNDGFEKKEYAVFANNIGVPLVGPRIVKNFVLPSTTTLGPFSFFPTEEITIRTKWGDSWTLGDNFWNVESYDASYFGNYQEISIAYGVANNTSLEEEE